MNTKVSEVCKIYKKRNWKIYVLHLSIPLQPHLWLCYTEETCQYVVKQRYWKLFLWSWKQENYPAVLIHCAKALDFLSSCSFIAHNPPPLPNLPPLQHLFVFPDTRIPAYVVCGAVSHYVMRHGSKHGHAASNLAPSQMIHYVL
jgi:hypothetical protein